ncbi:hypothetical protein JXA80_00210 [bacterium]|nr:hypothetical protein [candidate division CSSED10-310 bacterium]
MYAEKLLLVCFCESSIALGTIRRDGYGCPDGAIVERFSLEKVRDWLEIAMGSQ